MKSILGDLTRETIDLVFKECDKEKNKKHINFLINNIIIIAFKHLQPYLYTIMGILILLFLMNCFQFYYYIKLFVINVKSHEFDDIITKTI